MLKYFSIFQELKRKKMLEKFNDFKNTLFERIKSPFIGSFMITWSVIHWRVLLLLLYNQDNLSLKDRIANIESYLKLNDYSHLITKPILITLCVLLCYNLLNAVGLFIKLLYDNWISLYIQRFLHNKSIVERSKYDELKKEFERIKVEYDSKKVIYFRADEEYQKISSALDEFKQNAFEGQVLHDITLALNQNTQWEKTSNFIDGKIESEIFRIENNAFVTDDKNKIKIENVKMSKDGRILSFDKMIDKKPISNYLIKNNNSNYYGFEGDMIAVSYKPERTPHIKINLAKYKFDNNYIDVTSKIQHLVDLNTLEFELSNHSMGGDPGYGKQKTLELNYSIDKVIKNKTFFENDKIKFD
jgi:hypothetical protein